MPPSIQSAVAISSIAVDLLFTEPVENISCQNINNYEANNGLGNPASAVQDAINPSLVHLIFAKTFTNGTGYALLVNNVKDLAGNIVHDSKVNFSFYIPQQYDVVIDEIMADPSPQVALPDAEWIELKNTSSFPINLRGWKLSDLRGQTGLMPDFILQSDSFVVVCTGSAVSALSSFGKVISVTNFPSLDNEGDLISLISSSGKTIHSVKYTSAWYQNELKKDGGWSLEMIDTRNPCSGINNWKSSTGISGGTPGKKNSIDGVNLDETAPKLLRAFAKANDTITLVFNEPLDSLKAAAVNNYLVDNGISIKEAISVPPIFDKVNVVLNNPIDSGTIYTITANNVTDCKGNSISSGSAARFGMPAQPGNLDIVINEILYNPKPEGVDYVELYNRSQKIIDVNHIYIANRDGNVISNIQQAATESILLFPGDFMVLTSDVPAVKNQYITTNPDAFVTVSNMPSFPDDGGDVIILNAQGDIIDEVNYSDKWQFPLVSNTEGVSLERIDYNSTSVQSNFHSAATSSGYGTPGYKNSQYRIDENVPGTIKVSPDIFSPDNDGIDDFATIDYNFPAPGYIANITIFDASGRRIRYLEQNALCGIKGYYRWDGLDDKNRKLPQGIYVIYTEIFNTAGKKKQFKNSIVLARRY